MVFLMTIRHPCPSGIYPTNGPEACEFILQQSKCAILVVEDQKQLEKVTSGSGSVMCSFLLQIWSLRESLPYLKKIVQFSGTPTHPGVLSWGDLLAR